jgi:quercetin dioxygenase-like cupin family protein
MTHIDALAAARGAVALRLDRPATAIVHDSAESRLVVFRLEPGQAVAPHRSTSSVQLTVLEGQGVLSGESGEKSCGLGDVVVYAPRELHGMRALDNQLLLLATITPRPGDTHA